MIYKKMITITTLAVMLTMLPQICFATTGSITADSNKYNYDGRNTFINGFIKYSEKSFFQTEIRLERVDTTGSSSDKISLLLLIPDGLLLDKEDKTVRLVPLTISRRDLKQRCNSHPDSLFDNLTSVYNDNFIYYLYTDTKVTHKKKNQKDIYFEQGYIPTPDSRNNSITLSNIELSDYPNGYDPFIKFDTQININQKTTAFRRRVVNENCKRSKVKLSKQSTNRSFNANLSVSTRLYEW